MTSCPSILHIEMKRRLSGSGNTEIMLSGPALVYSSVLCFFFHLLDPNYGVIISLEVVHILSILIFYLIIGLIHLSLLQRYGVWGDWENPYLTLNPDYEAAQVSTPCFMFSRLREHL